MNVDAVQVAGPQVYNRDLLYAEYLAIQNKHGRAILEHQQIGLTHSPECPKASRFTEAVGRSHGYTADYVFNEEFKDWYVHSLYVAAKKLVGETGKTIGRVRFLRRAPNSCYSVHADDGKRLHMAVYTNPQALIFVEVDGSPNTFTAHHIPSNGRMYLVDTTRRHTFMNGGPTERIHLMMELA